MMLPALPLVLLLLDADLVVLDVVAVLVGLDHLDPVQLGEEESKEDHHGPRRPCAVARSFHDLRRRLVQLRRRRLRSSHPAGLSVAGRRAASEMRSSIASSSQFAINDEPPADMNGVVCPVSGIRRSRRR
jgi:hypothetical protein